MALPTKKTSKVSKSETHPFEIPVSLGNSRHSRIIVTNTICELEDGPNFSQSALDDKLNGQLRTTRTSVCMALVFAVVMVIVSLGSLCGLIWTISETKNQAHRIDVLEKDLLLKGRTIAKYESLFDVLWKEADVTATTIVPTTNTTTFSSSSSSSTSSPSSQTLPTSTISQTSTTSRKTTAPVPSTTLQPGGFKVNQTKEVTYSGYTFLAVQLEVPSNGLSKSENWCRDYELLCKNFSRRPTGCGEIHITNAKAKVCMEEYDSDMYNGNVLDCSPSEQIANIANNAFPNLATPAQNKYNAFGFHICDPLHCKKSIQDSENSLTYVRGVWEANETLVYTVCL